jgi:hypothetical protein
VVPTRPHSVAHFVHHLRVVSPENLAVGRVDRAYHVHAPDEVEHPVRDERSRDQAAVFWKVEIPVHGQLSHVPVVDLGQRTEPLLAIGPSEREPVVAAGFVGQRGVVGDRWTAFPASGRRENRQERKGQQSEHGARDLSVGWRSYRPEPPLARVPNNGDRIALTPCWRGRRAYPTTIAEPTDEVAARRRASGAAT